MSPRWPRLIAAFIAWLLGVPAIYSLLRAYDVLFKEEPDPATVAWSAHIAMFWRLGIGAFAAGMIALVMLVAAERDVARTLRFLSALVLVVAAMTGIQGLLLP